MNDFNVWGKVQGSVTFRDVGQELYNYYLVSLQTEFVGVIHGRTYSVYKWELEPTTTPTYGRILDQMIEEIEEAFERDFAPGTKHGDLFRGKTVVE